MKNKDQGAESKTGANQQNSSNDDYEYPERIPDQDESGYKSDEVAGYDPRIDVYSKPEDSFSEYANKPVANQGKEDTNQSIAEKIYHRFAEEGLDANSISVEVVGSQVTLKGKVKDQKARQQANTIATETADASQVVNQIQVA